MSIALIVLAVIGGLYLLGQCASVVLGYSGLGDYPDWFANLLFGLPQDSRLRKIFLNR